MDVTVVRAPFPAVRDLPFEVVERKGAGHPDTLCDAIAETASRLYSAFVQDTFGRLAHHWFDKVMLLGGQARVGYGQGELTRPYHLIFAGKGVRRVGDVRIPLEGILEEAASQVLTRVLRNFDPRRDLVISNSLSDYQGPTNTRSRYTPSEPADLADPRSPRVSNDANVCSGFAPLSDLESNVLALERYLTSEEFRSRRPDTGVDVKIVGIRKGSSVEVVVNMPLIAAEVASYPDYVRRVAEVGEEARAFLRERPGGAGVLVTMNPEDVCGIPYLTVTGSVADTGDVGVVGRGNRSNGLITPMRPMSIEAAAGKNPVDHTGKLYGILSQRIADSVHESHGLRNQVHVITVKERPIDDPLEVAVYYHSDSGEEIDDIDPIIKTAEHQVARVGDLTDELVGPGVELW